MSSNLTMLVVYYVEHGCLGPQGKDRIDDFCKQFSRHIKRALGDMGMQIFAAPRRKGDPEFRYVVRETPNVQLTEEAINSALETAQISRGDFEDGLADLATEYAESTEWREFLHQSPGA